MNTLAYDWVEVGRYAQRSDAEGNALALASVGIGSRLVGQEGGVALFVVADDALRAEFELAEYARENRRPPAAALRPAAQGVNAALAYCAVLIFTYVAAGRQLFGFDWWAAGAAQAGLISEGEWWRTLTALGLHADLGHLAGNIAAGSLFGILLAQVLGPGLGWFAIVTAAGLGNAVNALLQRADHTAIGASTAVFAALGLLSALMWRRQATPWARGMRRLLPLAAGATLLAYLGIGGERTDVGAHFAGFGVGVILGAVLHLLGSRVPHGSAAQFAFGAAALALFSFAWLMAFSAG